LLYLIDFISNLWTFCVAERTVAGDPVGIEQPSNVLKLHPMSPAQLGRIDDEDSGASMTRRVRLGTIECLHFHTGAQQRTAVFKGGRRVISPRTEASTCWCLVRAGKCTLQIRQAVKRPIRTNELLGRTE
jgi:hypothetical protein